MNSFIMNLFSILLWFEMHNITLTQACKSRTTSSMSLISQSVIHQSNLFIISSSKENLIFNLQLHKIQIRKMKYFIALVIFLPLAVGGPAWRPDSIDLRRAWWTYGSVRRQYAGLLFPYARLRAFTKVNTEAFSYIPEENPRSLLEIEILFSCTPGFFSQFSPVSINLI